MILTSAPAMLACKHCGSPIAAEKRNCESCGEDNGYPNVRIADSPQERTILKQRLNDAEISTAARRCKDVLDRFGTVILGSRAVISRSLAVVQDLIGNDRRSYTSYQRQLASGARVAEENEFDRIRTQVEAALFPNFHAEVVFGFLSLDHAPLGGYGAYSMVLKEDMISHRATVFEENLVVLSKRLRLILSDPIPPGYRAKWEHRDILAKAKLHGELESGMSDSDFSRILVNDRGGTGDSDFIEVHIFGPINRYTIDRVVGHLPKPREDRLIWRRLERQLKPLGISVETI